MGSLYKGFNAVMLRAFPANAVSSLYLFFCFSNTVKGSQEHLENLFEKFKDKEVVVIIMSCNENKSCH